MEPNQLERLVISGLQGVFMIQKYNTEIKIIKKYTTIVDDGRETKKIEYYIRNKLLSNLIMINK